MGLVRQLLNWVFNSWYGQAALQRLSEEDRRVFLEYLEEDE